MRKKPSDAFTLIVYALTDSLFEELEEEIEIVSDFLIEKENKMKEKGGNKMKEIRFNEEGICSHCGDEEIEYINTRSEYDTIGYDWKCHSCGSEGTEWYDVTFSDNELKEEL